MYVTHSSFEMNLRMLPFVKRYTRLEDYERIVATFFTFIVNQMRDFLFLILTELISILLSKSIGENELKSHIFFFKKPFYFYRVFLKL